MQTALKFKCNAISALWQFPKLEKCLKMGEVFPKCEKCFQNGESVSKMGEVFSKWEKCFQNGKSVFKMGEVFSKWEKCFQNGKSVESDIEQKANLLPALKFHSHEIDPNANAMHVNVNVKVESVECQMSNIYQRSKCHM